MKIFLLSLWCILIMHPLWADDSDYDSQEQTKIKGFLNQPSLIPGKTNAEIYGINPVNNMDSYPTAGLVYFIWTSSIPKKLTKFYAENFANVSGDFDLSGFSVLTSVTITKSDLQSINVTNCPSLTHINVYKNQLNSLDLSGHTKIDFIKCDENQLRFSTTTLPSDKKITTGFFPQAVVTYKPSPYVRVDLNSENIDRKTVYTWYKVVLITETLLVKGVDYTENEGVFYFNEAFKNADMRCKMTHKNYGNVTGNSLVFNVKLEDIAYHEGVITVLKDFLTLQSPVTGKTNAKQLGLSAAEIDLPAWTWINKVPGIEWVNVDNQLTIKKINWAGKNLSGSLDLTACGHLEELNCQNNNLEMLIAKVTVSNVSGNKLKFSTLRLSGYTTAQMSPQAKITGSNIPVTGEVNLSTEYNPAGVLTNYRWYELKGGSVTEIEAAKITANNGKFTFDVSLAGKKLYCDMTNSLYAGLTITYEVQILDNASNKIYGNLVGPTQGNISLYKFVYGSNNKPVNIVLVSEQTVNNSFVFDNLEAGDYAIVADATGYISGYYHKEGILQKWKNAAVLSIPSQEVINLNVLMQPYPVTNGTITIRGKVFENGKLKARPSRTMYLQQEPGNKSKTIAQIEIGADGEYEFTDLPPGIYEISIDEAGYNVISTHIIEALTENVVYDNYDFVINHSDKTIQIVNISWNPEIDLPQFSFYPNPAVDIISVKGLSGKYNASLYTLLGQILTSITSSDTEYSFNINNLAPGMYILKIELYDRGTLTRKFIKK